MAGAISSLGIGSGVLTSDVIDQLKEADESVIIKPIDDKIVSNNQKQDAYTMLSSLMTSFKTAASTLSYSTVFEAKDVTVSGEADVTVSAGANVESFTLETVELAQKDVTKFGSFGDKEVTPIASEAGVLTINGVDIAYDENSTLQDLAQAITDTVGDTVDASILQTGDGAYSLVLTSQETGADQSLTIVDSSGFLDSALLDPYDAATNPDGYQKIQDARDATFKFNGIEATRSTNSIDDFILGLNITLKEEGDISSVAIEQDSQQITGEMQLFVESYNSLMTNLNDMTVTDEEAGTKGIFASDSFVKSISRDLNALISSMGRDNVSIFSFGVDIDRGGTMSFDANVFEAKLKEDPSAVESFFTAEEDEDASTQTGFFVALDTKMKEYTGFGALLSTFETDLKTEGTNLSENRLSAQESLDARYAIMTQRFIAYDMMISQINAQFSSLQMMIDSESSN